MRTEQELAAFARGGIEEIRSRIAADNLRPIGKLGDERLFFEAEIAKLRKGYIFNGQWIETTSTEAPHAR